MHNKKRFLLISQPNSYRIAPYIKACDSLGLDCLLASRGEHSLISEVHNGLHIDLDDHASALQLILQAAEQQPFAGVLGSDDSTVELAAKVARELGLPHNPPEAALISHRKDLARAHLALSGCPVPLHCLIDISQTLEPQLKGLPYPCVLKPTNLSASRGVIRADTEQQVIDACARIKPILEESDDEFERSHLLIEQYIDGIEIAYEGFLQDGKLQTLTVFDKPDPLCGPFFEETIYVTPSSLDSKTQSKIKRRIQQACDAYQLRTGPIHAECRIDDEDIWILEVASRTIGGDCARTLDTGIDTTLEELTIKLAMGETIDTAPIKQASGVMMMPIPAAGILKRVEGLNDARNTPHIDKVEMVIPNGHELKPLPEGNQYPGYIFARADTTQQVVDALRTAYAQLNFVIAPLWKINAA